MQSNKKKKLLALGMLQRHVAAGLEIILLKIFIFYFFLHIVIENSIPKTEHTCSGQIAQGSYTHTHAAVIVNGED